MDLQFPFLKQVIVFCNLERYNERQMGGSHAMVKTIDFNESQKKVHLTHDTTHRHFLAVKKLFVELFQSFVNEGWVQEVHEGFLNDYVSQDFLQKRADLVYKVRLNNDDILFYVLTEMQSTVDFEMPFRLLEYQVEIWRHWLKHEDETRPLPVIVPIVLYNGEPPWTASRKFREILDGEHLFGPKELVDFEYFLIDVVRYDEEQLLTLANTISSVFMLDQAQDRLNRLRDIVQQLTEKNPEICSIFGSKTD
jgi:hypothetical protein